MRTNLRTRALTAAVGAVLATTGTAIQASGFQLMEQSASGLGVAFAGMAAAAQDASTAFWNPAAMSLLPGVQGAAVLSYVAPHTEFTSDSTSRPNNLGDGGSDGAPNAWVPALHATWMLSPQWSVGLSVNAPFGLTTEWDTPWNGQTFAVKSTVETLNINPSASFKVNDQLSLGAGLSYQQLKAELTNAVAPVARAPIGKVEGTDWALGWNVGALIDFQQGTRVGLTYRSAIDYTVQGGELSVGGADVTPVTADIELPDTFSIAVSHQLTPDTRILADWTWTGWSTIQNLTVKQATVGMMISNSPLNFDDSWRAGLGVEHQLNPSWLLRAGVAYDKTPVQDEFRTPRLPDEDRTWLAIGARYQPDAKSPWWIDVGYSYLWVDNATSELRNGPLRLDGEYDANINLVAAQVSFKY
ncbi:MAG: OmpP1/FadL family transporter [Gammaproteobacteria bacterium]|nr:OmpP1/FadL family transporter [Gammaproteobacteria bacterium]